MVTLFDDEVDVGYGFVLLLAQDAAWPDLGEARGGQRNGLCGAACPGVLSLVTSTTWGAVPLRVDVHDAPPPVDPAWQDVVEASLVTTTTALALHSFDHAVDLPPLPVAGSYRVRYSAQGMDDAHDMTRAAAEPVVDRYLLELWPAPPAPDAVLRCTSDAAAYWHRAAAETPPPPTPEQRAAAAAAEAERERVRRQEAEDAWQRRRWGGRLPSPRLLALGNAAQLATRDRDLVEAVLDASDETRRTLTVWAVRRGCAAAGEQVAAVLAPAVAAVERGTRVPPPFDDPSTAWDALYAGPATLSVELGVPTDGVPPAIDGGAAALSAVLAASAADPAAAAAGAIDAIASGPLGGVALDEARTLLGLPPAGVRVRHLW